MCAWRSWSASRCCAAPARSFRTPWRSRCEEISDRGDGGPLVVEARIWAESESQKAILIGAGGRMVKAIGTAARKEIEAATGRRVHLDLSVRVRKGWRRDDGLLDRLGIE